MNDSFANEHFLAAATGRDRPAETRQMLARALLTVRKMTATARSEVAYRHRVYQTSRSLAALGDAALRDIGLHRCDIGRAARRAAKSAGHRYPR